MRARNLLVILGAALTTQPAPTPNAGVVRHERQLDHGDRTQALIEEWKSKRITANIAAQFYAISDRPFAKKPRPADPRQPQFHEQTFIDAAMFFRRAGGDIAVGAANAGALSVIGDDAHLWLRVLRQQQRGRWDRERKMLFAQAVEALRIITNEGGHIRNTCDWQPLQIESFAVVARRRDEIDIEVRIVNPNDADSPVAALCLLWLLFGAPLVRWPNKTSFPALKRTKTKFTLRFVKGELDVRFARSSVMREH